MRIVDLDENLYQNISESFDKTLEWKPSFTSKYTREFYTEVDGKELKINYYSPDSFESEMAISFSVNDRSDITGAGNASAIFGAVINHINDFVKSNDIQKIKFAAHKPEGGFGVRDTSRSNLYQKMVKKLSNSLGFEYSIAASGNDDIFTMVRKPQTTNEETSSEIIDNVEGWGSVPNNQNVNYLGLRVLMKPSLFLLLAAPIDKDPTDAVMRHLRNKGKIGSPFLQIKIPQEWEDGDLSPLAAVSGHEGRNRMKSILKIHGDIPIETHLFFTHGLRRRHLTDDMIANLKKNLQSEVSKKPIKGPLFTLVEHIKEDGRIVKGVNTTVDVGVDEIKKQAAKFGNKVDKDGRPPTLSKKVKGSSTNVLFNVGIAETKFTNHKTKNNAKLNTCKIFPDLENELTEGPLDTLRKIGRGAALATSIGTAGTMGALGYGALGQNSASAATSSYSQLAPSASKTPKPRPQQAEPEKNTSGSVLAPEKSPKPVARPSSLTLTDSPEEKKLLVYAQNNGITGDELAALMAQVAVETQGFTRMVERGSKSYFNRYEPEYSPKRANILGNKNNGDGFKYRGRGYVQLTGRYNYYRAGKDLGLDLINKPDLAANPENALKIALWYWNWRVSPSTDNFDNVKKVTYLINGGYHGLDKRELYFDKYIRRINLASQKTENKKYTALELAIMEGGHSLEERPDLTTKKTNLFSKLLEGIRIQLERDDDLYVLHIRDGGQKHRVEVRGKSGYERGDYDKQDQLHHLLDNLGKAANISDLMNGEPVYINPDHPDGPSAIKYLKKAMNETKQDDSTRIHPTSVRDHYRGESFGEKLLSVDGILKARITLSILSDEVYIQHIETAKDSQRKGYAKQLVDDLFREFPRKTISISMMTDDGSKFFRSQYRVDDETGVLTQK